MRTAIVDAWRDDAGTWIKVLVIDPVMRTKKAALVSSRIVIVLGAVAG